MEKKKTESKTGQQASLSTVIGDILRNRSRLFETIRTDKYFLAGLQLIIFAAIFFALYGFFMVVHIDNTHATKIALKLPLVFGASILLTMPTLYVFSAIKGSKLGLKQMFSSVLSGFALTSIVMFALVPVTWLFGYSNASEGFLKFLNFSFIVGSVIGGFVTINASFKYISTYDEKGGSGYKGMGTFLLWTVLFLLVFAQMTANFGPFFEKSDSFMREERKSFLEVFFAPEDKDKDGLSDESERNIYLTDPNKADTDEDGMFDKWEVDYGYDPLTKDSWDNLR